MVRLFLLLEGHNVLHFGRLELRTQCPTHLLLDLGHLLLLLLPDVVDLDLIHLCLSLLFYSLLLELSTMLFSHTRRLLLTLPAIFILEPRNQGTGLSQGRRGKLSQCSLVSLPLLYAAEHPFQLQPSSAHALVALALAGGRLPAAQWPPVGPEQLQQPSFLP